PARHSSVVACVLRLHDDTRRPHGAAREEPATARLDIREESALAREQSCVEEVTFAFDELERLACHATCRENDRRGEREERARVSSELEIAQRAAHAHGAER